MQNTGERGVVVGEEYKGIEIDETSGAKITICGDPGRQVKDLIKALRTLADAIEQFV